MNTVFNRFATKCGMLVCLLSFQPHLQSVWEPATVISNPATPQVVDLYGVLKVNPQGNALAIWNDLGNPVFAPPFDPFNATIQTSFFQRGVGWGPPVIISNLQMNEAEKPLYNAQGDPDIGLNSSNYAVAVWEASFNMDNFPQVVVGTFRNPISGSWAPVSILSDQSGNVLAENINVSLNEAGLALAAWRDHDEISNVMSVGVSFLPQNGIWTPFFDLQSFVPVPGDGKPWPSLNPSGNAAVTVQGSDENDNFLIIAATYNALTNTWSPNTILDSDAGLLLSEDPRCAMDPTGHAVAVWQNEGNVRTSYFNGTAWEPFITIGNCNVQLGFDSTDIVVDPQGNYTVTWTGVNFDIQTSFRLPNGTWSAPQVISTPGTSNFFNPFQSEITLAVNPIGDLIQVWFSTPNVFTGLSPDQTATEMIVSAFKPFGQPWQAPIVVDASGDYNNDHHTLNVGLANCGFAVADWQTFGNTLVKASINQNLPSAGLTPNAVVARTCCDKFGMQTQCVAFIEIAPNTCALFFNIYSNGVLVATVPNTFTSTMEVIVPICNKKKSVFTITSVNFSGIEGPQTLIATF
jgi:hypothetical protein